MNDNLLLFESDLNDFSIEAKEKYERAYRISNSYLSNSCFLHRICWNELFKYKYQIIGDCLCLVADDNIINHSHIVFPLGRFNDNELKMMVTCWRDEFKRNNRRLRIEYIDDYQLPRLRSCLEREDFIWHLDYCEDYWDYTYQKWDYLNLQGKRNKSKRNYWNHYLANSSLYHIEKISANNISEVARIIEIWESQMGISENSLINTDHYPLQFYLNHFDQVDSCSYLLFRGEKAIAFFVASIKGTHCYFHFAKSNRKYPAANYIMHRLFLESADAIQIAVLNFEDDMSNLNIRKYKTKIAHYSMTRKYAIEVE